MTPFNISKQSYIYASTNRIDLVMQCSSMEDNSMVCYNTVFCVASFTIRTVTVPTWATSWRVGSGWWRITAAGSTGSTTPAAPTPLTWTSPTTSSCCACPCTSSSTSSSPACSSPSSLASSSIYPLTQVGYNLHESPHSRRVQPLCIYLCLIDFSSETPPTLKRS